MIFNSEKVEQLVADWKLAESPKVMEQIVAESIPLAEVIASGFSDDSNHREDLIQECLMKLPRCIKNYNPKFSMHKYLTSAFRHTCMDYLYKYNKYKDDDELPDYIPHPDDAAPVDMGDIIITTIERNRGRFPSIDTSVIDSLTKYIIDSMMEGLSPGRSNGLDCWDGLSRGQATVVYHSTLIFLRSRYSQFALADYPEPEELSLLQDLLEVFGPLHYENMSLLFAGTVLRIPA